MPLCVCGFYQSWQISSVMSIIRERGGRRLKFTKMHGIGNDYVYVNCLEEKVENPERLAKFVSDRHFGIGSDGLILINPSKTADFEMRMYNADGSGGQMCGNGIRCVAKYVYDYGLTTQTHISVDTLAGIKYLDLTVENGKVSLVKVNMGAPELTAGKVPVAIERGQEAEGETLPDKESLSHGGQTDDKEQVIDAPIQVDGRDYRMTCVSMGNPHCVIFMEEDVRGLDLEKMGPMFENHPWFPERINTEFVNVIDKHTLRMRVWERGSGETLACGTGACATAVAAVLNDKAEGEITVQLLGGDLQILWEGGNEPVYMTGPAAVVFDGEIVLPEGIS